MTAISSRVAVAIHILVYLTWRRGALVSSPEIAKSVNTHPVVVRRLVGALRDAGLVQVEQGVNGGARIVRAPGEIELLYVYRAVEGDDDLFALHPHGPSPNCSVGANIVEVLTGVFGKAEAAMEAVLARVTLQDVWDDIAERLGHASSCDERSADDVATSGASAP